MYRTNKSDHLSAIPNLEKGFQYIVLKNAIGWRFYIGILYQSLLYTWLAEDGPCILVSEEISYNLGLGFKK